MLGVREVVAEDLSGKQFGDYEIIGDTGKRSNRGHQIVIARNKKTGELMKEKPEIQRWIYNWLYW